MSALRPHLFLCDVSGSVDDINWERIVFPAIQAKTERMEAGIDTPVFVWGIGVSTFGNPIEVTSSVVADPLSWKSLAERLGGRNGGTDLGQALNKVLDSGFIAEESIGRITVFSDLLDWPFLQPVALEGRAIQVDFLGLPDMPEEYLKAFAEGVSSWAKTSRADLSSLTPQKPDPERGALRRRGPR